MIYCLCLCSIESMFRCINAQHCAGISCTIQHSVALLSFLT